MAFEEEIQPKCKLATNPNEKVYRIDGMFPAIDNLVHFPTEILMPIFAGVDDIGLLHIASINQRFGSIAQIVFEQRYGDKYFVIKGEAESDRELYWEMFRVFGDGIKAIKSNELQYIDQNHWMARMLQKLTKNVEKISFHSCSFTNATGFLSQHLHITDLQIQGSDASNNFDLPEYRHLKKLELSNFDYLPAQSFERTIRNNPQLESLVLRSKEYSALTDVMRAVCTHQRDLKELKVLHTFHYRREPLDWTPLNSVIDEFTDTVKGIESLAIPFRTGTVELFRQLGRKCKRIERLELLEDLDEIDNEMVQALRSMDTVEHLTLHQYSYDETVELVVGSLPRLRSLTIDTLYLPSTFNYILSLLRICPGLEMMTFMRFNSTSDAPERINMHFHSEFVQLAVHPNAKVEFIECGQTIGIVTKNEIIWRGKLIHWIDYESNHSKTNLNLLDLANLQKPSDPEKEDPFGVILNYLDLGSLYALSQANKRSEQLVKSYVQRRSSQKGTFVITDEFKMDYNGLRAFGPYVNNLVVIRLHCNIKQLQSIVRKYYNLRKLCYHSHIGARRFEFIFPQVRHVVYNNQRYPASFYLLYKMSRSSPDLETLELGEVDRFFGRDGNHTHFFRELKKFKFKPSSQNQVEFIKDLFKNMSTEVIIDN